MYICPVCKELNEEHRKYCKACGTWLLSTKFPALPVKKKMMMVPSYKTSNKWLQRIVLLEAILFVLLALLTKGEHIFGLFSLFGLLGIVIFLIACIVLALFKRLKESIRSMTVYLLCSLALFIFGGMMSTGKTHLAVASTAPAEQAREWQDTQLYQIGDTINVERLTYVVTDAVIVKEIKSSFGSKKTAESFMVVTLHVTNNDKEARFIDASMYKLHDSSGRIFDPDAGADMFLNNNLGFFLQKMNPGIRKEAKIAFEVPSDAKDVKLAVTSGFGWSGGKTAFISLGNLQ